MYPFLDLNIVDPVIIAYRVNRDNGVDHPAGHKKTVCRYTRSNKLPDVGYLPEQVPEHRSAEQEPEDPAQGMIRP